MAPKSGQAPPGTPPGEHAGNSSKNVPKWKANGKPNGRQMGDKIDEKRSLETAFISRGVPGSPQDPSGTIPGAILEYF